MRHVLYRSCIDSLTGKIVQRINCRLNARTRCGSIVPVLRDACRQTTPPWQSNSSLEQLSPSTRKIPSSIRRLNHLVVRGLVKRQLLVPQSLSLAVPRHPRQVPPSSFRPVCGPARRSRASQEYLEKVFNIRRVPVVGYVKGESEPGRLCRKYADARKRYTRDAERRRIERRIGRTRTHTHTYTHTNAHAVEISAASIRIRRIPATCGAEKGGEGGGGIEPWSRYFLPARNMSSESTNYLDRRATANSPTNFRENIRDSLSDTGRRSIPVAVPLRRRCRFRPK